MIEHNGRSHAQWSASATSRNVVCAGAIAMETLCEGRETEAAAWGTTCHQLAEHCLRALTDAIAEIGVVEKVGKFEVSVDEEMAATAQTYIDYCRSRLKAYYEATGDSAQCWIEHKLTLDALDWPSW